MNLSAKTHPSANTLAMTGGILSVVLGWYTHKLIQVSPNFAPMQFNTALSFLFTGIALILTVRQHALFATVLCIFVVLVAALTLIEYVFGINLGVDQLLMTHQITTETSHPGRMALDTAFFFFCRASHCL
jgi:multisubunit Na+/H+ antiporter MnhE subunit